MSHGHPFGDLLLELRVGRGLSQEELAADAKLSVRAISDLERGVTRRPHRDTIRALALALGLPTEDRTTFERLARREPPVRPRPRDEAPVRVVPFPTTSLVGRDDDLAALLRLVRAPAVRLVTVTGWGGVGKTRLAVEVAWRAANACVHLVDLTALTAADTVPAAIAVAWGMPAVSSVAALAARVGAQERLLVLDSAEHVPELALQVSRLLAACPGLTVLATSRGPLRLQGEHLWPLAPLALPGPAADRQELLDNPAVALLVERTRAVRPGFALSTSNSAALAGLCRRLDGLPLAIELAAARLRTRDPDDLLAELTVRLAGLSADVLDRPDRQQSLHATVAWTLRQLRPDERDLVGVVSTFAGGAALEHVRRVLAAAGFELSDVEASVAVLADAQLIAVLDRQGQARLRMLDTIREVAAEIATVAGADARGPHARCFLDLIRTAGSAEVIDAELDNVRAAVDWALTHEPSYVDECVVAALSGYFRERGYFPEAYRVLTAIAEATHDLATRAQAWCGAGIAANENGQPDQALRLARVAAGAFEALGDQPAHCTALALLGNAFKALGDYPGARAAHEQCLALARTAGDLRPLTVALNNLGTVAEDLGDYATARAHYAESLSIKERHGDRRGVAVAHNNLGGLAAEIGDYPTACAHLSQAAEAFRSRGERHSLAFSLAMLSQAYLGVGDPNRARSCAEEALRVASAVEYGHGVGLALARLGDLARHDADSATAREHYTRALEQPIGLPETIRTLERLAAASAAEPATARALLDDAARLRADHHLPPSPTARLVIASVGG